MQRSLAHERPLLGLDTFSLHLRLSFTHLLTPPINPELAAVISQLDTPTPYIFALVRYHKRVVGCTKPRPFQLFSQRGPKKPKKPVSWIFFRDWIKLTYNYYSRLADDFVGGANDRMILFELRICPRDDARGMMQRQSQEETLLSGYVIGRCEVSLGKILGIGVGEGESTLCDGGDEQDDAAVSVSVSMSVAVAAGSPTGCVWRSRSLSEKLWVVGMDAEIERRREVDGILPTMHIFVLDEFDKMGNPGTRLGSTSAGTGTGSRVCVDQMPGSEQTLTVRFACEGLPKMDIVGSCDAYIMVKVSCPSSLEHIHKIPALSHLARLRQVQEERSEWKTLWKSSVVPRSYTPSWKAVRFRLGDVIGEKGDIRKRIRLELWDYDSLKEDDYIGSVEMDSVSWIRSCIAGIKGRIDGGNVFVIKSDAANVERAGVPEIELIDLQDERKDLEAPLGRLKVERCRIRAQPTFIDLLTSRSLRLSVSIAVDLSWIARRNMGGTGLYEMCLQSIVTVFNQFASLQGEETDELPYWCYGYGVVPPATTASDQWKDIPSGFALREHILIPGEDPARCEGLQQVLQAFRGCIVESLRVPKSRLSGENVTDAEYPLVCDLGQVVQTIARRRGVDLEDEEEEGNPSTYHVICVVSPSDEGASNFRATASALMNATYSSPVSVILVGLDLSSRSGSASPSPRMADSDDSPLSRESEAQLFQFMEKLVPTGDFVEVAGDGEDELVKLRNALSFVKFVGLGPPAAKKRESTSPPQKARSRARARARRPAAAAAAAAAASSSSDEEEGEMMTPILGSPGLSLSKTVGRGAGRRGKGGDHIWEEGAGSPDQVRQFKLEDYGRLVRFARGLIRRLPRQAELSCRELGVVPQAFANFGKSVRLDI